MAAILYRGVGIWRVVEDDEIAAALADGWYVLTAAGHIAPPLPEPASSPEAEPVAPMKRGRPPKAKE